MRRLRPAVAFLAIASFFWSFGAELEHEHSAFDQAEFECAVDHERVSNERHDSEKRISKAGLAHRHDCFACRTGQQRPLTVGSLRGVAADELIDDAPAVADLVRVRLLLPSGLSSRGPPSV